MIKHCLFPAGGYGMRFYLKLNPSQKKGRLSASKPLVEYGVDETTQAGMISIAVVTGFGESSLMDHFDKNYELEHQIQATNKEPLLDDIHSLIDSAQYTFFSNVKGRGLGHAGKELVGDNPFSVVLADDLRINGCAIPSVLLIYCHGRRSTRIGNARVWSYCQGALKGYLIRIEKLS